MLACTGLAFGAVVVAFVLKRTVLKASPAPFVMELPPYRLPNVRTIIQNMLTRAWLFVKRAGTVILAISIVLWALMYFPRSSVVEQPMPDAAATSFASDVQSPPGDVAASK